MVGAQSATLLGLQVTETHVAIPEHWDVFFLESNKSGGKKLLAATEQLSSIEACIFSWLLLMFVAKWSQKGCCI